MISVDPRKEKIREFKKSIKINQEKVVEILTSINVEEELKTTPEEQEAKKKERKDQVALLKAELVAVNDQLKTTRMNKTGSSFFEFTPHTGFNRRQARLFKKRRRSNDTSREKKRV